MFFNLMTIFLTNSLTIHISCSLLSKLIRKFSIFLSDQLFRRLTIGVPAELKGLKVFVFVP